jgi:hypothetical protein
MARKRMIYAELFEDEHFGKLSDKAKLLFIACIANADDDGRLNAHEANLRAYAFRYEEISLVKIKSLLSELTNTMSNFKYYIVRSCNYIEFSKWNEYQHIREDRYKQSTIPKWQPSGNQVATNGMLNVSEVKVKEVKVIPHFPFEQIYSKYPKKIGRPDAERHFKDSVKSEVDFANIQKALQNYLNYIENEKVQLKYIKHASAWFNQWRNWVEVIVDIPVTMKCKQCGYECDTKKNPRQATESGLCYTCYARI